MWLPSWGNDSEIVFLAGHLYNDMQSVVDFISGMTDLFAVDLYRKITGMAFPQIR